ncbi:MAG: outer membrane lipoprotein-sorting protein [Planctomycetes bacterium]|nr:outer membrane lipoprotein-sorting protein [Planctomycetota bacterium]
MVASVAAGGSAKSPTTAASEPAVARIVDRTNYVAYYQGASGRATVKMTIVDAQKRKRFRKFTILRRDEASPQAKDEKDPAKLKKLERTYCRGQKLYVYFHQPADVNKMGFLVWKHPVKDDDRWLYLPALDLVKRIASADKRTSFVGSDFFNTDASGHSITDDKHELVETTKNYYVLKNTPKEPKKVEFSSFKMWIHRKTSLPVQISFYDKRGKEYRRYKALAVKTIQGYPTAVKAQMTNLRTKGFTTIEYSDIKYDVGIPEDIFSERYLRKPPRKYLK